MMFPLLWLMLSLLTINKLNKLLAVKKRDVKNNVWESFKNHLVFYLNLSKLIFYS